MNLLLVYDLPFGKGKAFGAHNRLVGAVAGGWQLSGITTYRFGAPIGSILGSCNLPDAGRRYANYAAGFAGPIRINGGWGSGNVLGANAATSLNAAAFTSPASYTYGNTLRTAVYGMTLPGSYDQDLSLRRTFPFTEKRHLVSDADAINVFNFINFGGQNLTVTSSNFGKITSQSNGPRVLQLAARVAF